jgi:hypothetical protein
LKLNRKSKKFISDFAAESHQPLKPMLKINPPAIGANRRLYVPREKNCQKTFHASDM